MSLSSELKESVGDLWDKTVSHPFVKELGDGSLPEEVFDIYFKQDHIFLKDWIALMAAGVMKAPDFPHARPLASFIHLALGGEEGLFQDYFRERGLSEEQVRYLRPMPTTMAYGGFLRRIAYEGSFHDIVTVLLGIEWPYLEWGKRLESQGAKPGNKYYQTWIDLHAAKELDDFVSWMREVLDGSTVGHPARLKSLFLSAMRYEYMFWEMAYRGETWPV